MKKLYLPALLLLTYCRLPQQQPFILDAHVTVTLPGKPYVKDTRKYKRLKHPELMKAWTFNTVGGTYHLLRAVNPAMLITTHDTLAQEAYYDRKVEVLKEHKAHVLLASSFTVNGVKGRDITYESHASSQPTLVYSRNFVLDSVSYVLDFFPAYQEGVLGFAGAEQRRHFFNSIEIKL